MLIQASRRALLVQSSLSLALALRARPFAALAQGTGATDCGSCVVTTPYEHGAVGNGVADDSLAIQRALNFAIDRGGILDLAHGAYRVSRSIVAARARTVRIVNSGLARIQATAGNYAAGAAIVIEGSARVVGALEQFADEGDTSLRASAADAFDPGDLGILYNPADFSFSRFRPYYRAGEFIEPIPLGTEIMDLRRPLYGRYAPGEARVGKVEPVTGFIRNIDIRSDGGPPCLLRIDYANGLSIADPVLRQTGDSCLVVARSVHCTIERPDAHNEGVGGDDYSIVFANSQHCRLSGGEAFAPRHPVAIGGGDFENGVPSRDVVVSGATLRNDPATGTHCADIHGNGEMCGFEGCVIFGGFSPQGRASFLRNSTVYSMPSGVATYAAELVGGRHVMEGNVFHLGADPSASDRGALDFGGNSSAVTSFTVEDLSVIVRDNTFNSSSLGPNTMLLYIRNEGSRAKVNVIFTDNRLRVNNFGAMVRVRLARGTAASEFIEVERNQTSLGGRPSFYPEEPYRKFVGGNRTKP